MRPLHCVLGVAVLVLCVGEAAGDRLTTVSEYEKYVARHLLSLVKTSVSPTEPTELRMIGAHILPVTYVDTTIARATTNDICAGGVDFGTERRPISDLKASLAMSDSARGVVHSDQQLERLVKALAIIANLDDFKSNPDGIPTTLSPGCFVFAMSIADHFSDYLLSIKAFEHAQLRENGKIGRWKTANCPKYVPDIHGELRHSFRPKKNLAEFQRVLKYIATAKEILWSLERPLPQPLFHLLGPDFLVDFWTGREVDKHALEFLRVSESPSDHEFHERVSLELAKMESLLPKFPCNEVPPVHRIFDNLDYLWHYFKSQDSGEKPQEDWQFAEDKLAVRGAITGGDKVMFYELKALLDRYLYYMEPASLLAVSTPAQEAAFIQSARAALSAKLHEPVLHDVNTSMVGTLPKHDRVDDSHRVVSSPPSKAWSLLDYYTAYVTEQAVKTGTMLVQAEPVRSALKVKFPTLDELLLHNDFLQLMKDYQFSACQDDGLAHFLRTTLEEVVYKSVMKIEFETATPEMRDLIGKLAEAHVVFAVAWICTDSGEELDPFCEALMPSLANEALVRPGVCNKEALAFADVGAFVNNVLNTRLLLDSFVVSLKSIHRPPVDDGNRRRWDNVLMSVASNLAGSVILDDLILPIFKEVLGMAPDDGGTMLTCAKKFLNVLSAKPTCTGFERVVDSLWALTDSGTKAVPLTDVWRIVKGALSDD